MNSIQRENLNTEIEKLKKKYSNDRSALLPMLRDLQEKYRGLSDYIIQELAHSLDIHPSEVDGTASFYSFLKRNGKYGKYVIRLCQTISCDIQGKQRIAGQLENELGIKFGETTKDEMFTLEYCNCLGMCDQGPAMMINHTLIAKLQPADIPIIINSCKTGNFEREYHNTIVSKVMEKGPLLEDEFKNGTGLKIALRMEQPETLIELLKETKLKGRGGAGFPTWLKWKFAQEANGEQKYVVCNADEGEPGTFKDRYILHKNTDRVLEGMTIAAHTIGASKGFIYLRAEYFYLKEIIENAIRERKKLGLLGKDIGGKEGFDFDIEIRMGAGAYICGEETALIESLEGLRGEPRNRPPYPVDTGFNNMPTIVNNVETFLDVNLICEKGPDFFKKYGTSKSSGTKFFSISGDCENQGIYELPFGTTIKELLLTVGVDNIKAVQIGGAAGKCIHKDEFENIIAYEAIPTGGSIILFNENRDMLDIAKNFMEFFIEESCGQCTPCREGNLKLLEGIKLLKEGKCSIAYLDKLISLGKTMQIASKCGLGQSSPNAFISIMENFRDEILGRLPKGAE